MNQVKLEQLWKQGILYREIGNLSGSVECWREALSMDPEDGSLHAQLAITLLLQKRIHAAAIESELALAAAPDQSLSHFARARVLIAHRKPRAALDHIDQALALEPQNAYNLFAKADIQILLDQHDQARQAMLEALQLDPDNATFLAAMGDWHLRRGQLDEAEQFAHEALGQQPDNSDALILMGHISLKRGDIEDAREHCIWALRQNPNSEEAIQLLCAIKARDSRLLGLWWRFQSSLIHLPPSSIIAVLLGMYLTSRILAMVLADMGQKDASQAVSLVWLIFAVYTWIAPSMFRRMIEKELKQVQLKGDF